MSGGKDRRKLSRRKLSRRDFLLLSGAGVMGVTGAGLLGAHGYRRLDARNPNSLESPVSRVAGSLGLSGGGSGYNVVLVVLDSLRKDYVGAYGNDWIQTPNLDALAAESLRFTRAIPEAMPTVPARRSIHTGMRSFPFRDYAPPKGENVLLYGWQPVPEEQWTLAEILQSSGYATMLISDANHIFKPSYNFQRGFGAFDFIRGQEKDLFRPTWLCPEERISNTLMSGDRANVEGKMRQYFANTADREGEEDYFAPRVFSNAADWLAGAKESGKPFFMVIDSFDPHEPWDPPEQYVALYDEGYEGKEPYAPVYGNADYLEERELERMKALYAAEVTMVDRWFGRFMDGMSDLGLMEDTLVLLVSDHGIAFGEHGTVGKPPYALWPEVTDVPFLIRHPGGKRAGEESDYRASTHDIAPTVLGFLGLGSPYEMDGEDLSGLFDGEDFPERPYIAGGLHDYAFARDDDYALVCRSSGGGAKLYDLREDPGQQNDVSGGNRGISRRMYEEYILAEAGGEMPSYGV